MEETGAVGAPAGHGWLGVSLCSALVLLGRQGGGAERSRSYFYIVGVVFRITRCLWLGLCLASAGERTAFAAWVCVETRAATPGIYVAIKAEGPSVACSYSQRVGNCLTRPWDFPGSSECFLQGEESVGRLR